MNVHFIFIADLTLNFCTKKINKFMEHDIYLMKTTKYTIGGHQNRNVLWPLQADGRDNPPPLTLAQRIYMILQFAP